MLLTIKNMTLLVLMLISALLGAILRPTISLADERAPIELSVMVPAAFGDWREDTQVLAQVVNPQQRSAIDKIYSQTLSRTYINTQGYRVMLSIAYGKNQSDALQLHKPEICYPAQGFTLLNKQSTALNLSGRPIAATRLTTNLGQRHEPVTYWTVMGDHNVTSSTDKKFVEINYAMGNRVPDGMLVRVSSIDSDTDNAFLMQTQFATAMSQAIPVNVKSRFLGAIGNQRNQNKADPMP